jgi:hypothetical protein
MQIDELGATVAHRVLDVFYVTIGLGVIGATNLHDLLERPTVDSAPLTDAIDSLNERLDTVTTELDTRFAAVEARVDAVLDQFEDGLPDAAREVVANARGVAKEARAQLRGFTARAA